MIKNISKLKNFGIFSNYQKENETSDFAKFNLFYGWNGSGKSTLSTLFQAIEECQVPPKFPDTEFIITLDDDTLLTQNSINNSKTNISTFNQNFIQKNINWDNSVKSILIVSEGKISEIDKLEKLKLQFGLETKEIAEKTKALNALDKNISDFLTTSARNTKDKFQILDTKDTYYLNYNKTKIDNFINNNKKELENETSLLCESDVIKVTSGAKPNKKPAITSIIKKIDEELYKKAKERLEKLFSTNVTNKTLERLKENTDIQNWVSTGLDLHKKHNVGTCEFCQSTINEDRLKNIEQHFSNDFKEFKLRLINADQWLENQYLKIEFLPSYDIFYDEFQIDYKKSFESAIIFSDQLNLEVSKWHEALRKKIEDPFEKNLIINNINSELLINLNQSLAEIEKYICDHNNKSTNFETETNKRKEKNNLNYITCLLQLKNFNTIKNLMKKIL